jgi:hypothetical protein
MFAAVMIIAITTGSIVYRLQRSKPIMKTEFRESRFSETWCSGQSDRNMLARLPIAKNILWVTVTKNELHVSPHFPFSLMFFPEAFGLDHRVPGRAIVEVRENSMIHGRAVLVKYRHATGDEETLKLRVNETSSLLRALLEISH